MKARRIEDASERLYAAESRLREFDYAGAMLEAQRCIEISVKSLLDKLNIEYKMKDGRIPHDVSDKIPKAFEKIKPLLKDWEINNVRIELARSAVLLRFLTSIRGYLEYGVNDLAGSKETFSSIFAEKLAKIIVDLVKTAHWRISNLITKID